eukprot:1509693-Alexandrium_andersonii.AAC.1
MPSSTSCRAPARQGCTLGPMALRHHPTPFDVAQSGQLSLWVHSWGAVSQCLGVALWICSRSALVGRNLAVQFLSV